jgi:O-antigen ligase
MWGYRTSLFLVLFCGGCVFALVDPMVGAVAYILVYQIMPNDRWWGMPLADWGMRFSMLAAAFTIVGLLTGGHRLPRARPWMTLWEFGAVLILLIAALTTFVSGIGAHHSSQLLFDKMWKMLLFVLVLSRLITTRRNLRAMLWAVVIGTLYLGHDAYTAPSDAYVFGRLQTIGGPDFTTTSGLAAHMAAVIPLVGVMVLTGRNALWRLLAIASGVLAVNTIILCRTRSAFIGIIFGVAAAMLAAPRRRRVRIIALLLISITAGYALTDIHFWDRMSTMSSRDRLHQDVAAMQRMEIWRAGIRMLSDYPHGIGLGNFPILIGKYDMRNPARTSHNTLLVCFVELGVPGGMIFLMMTGLGLMNLRRAARLAGRTSAPLENRLIVYGALVSFVTYYVTGLGTERFYCESFWWVFALPNWLVRTFTNEVAEELPELARDAEPAWSAAVVTGGGGRYHGFHVHGHALARGHVREDGDGCAIL